MWWQGWMRFLHGPGVGWHHVESSPLAHKGSWVSKRMLGHGLGESASGSGSCGAVRDVDQDSDGLPPRTVEILQNQPENTVRHRRATFRSCHIVDAKSLSALTQEAKKKKKSTQRGFTWYLLTSPNPLRREILEEGGEEASRGRWGRVPVAYP